MRKTVLSVLLIDDEIGIREPLAKFLRNNYDLDVETAATGRQAWEKVLHRDKPYHVVVIDDLLVPDDGIEPRPMGIELMEKIKGYSPQTEAIVFTAWGPETALDVLRAGAVHYLTKPLNFDLLAMLIRHASEYRQLKGAAREKQILERLMDTSTALITGEKQGEVFDLIVSSVHKIGFDRVRLYLVSDNGKKLVGRAHVGMPDNFISCEWTIDEDYYLQLLINDPRPQVFRRETGKPVPFEEKLEKEGVDEWACVPVLLKGEVKGKLSVDNKISRRLITEDDLRPIALFAAQAAAAIEKARLLESVSQRAERLDALRRTTLAITSLPERNKLLSTIAQQAVELLKAKSGGIYAYYPDRGELTVLVDHNRPEHLGKVLKVGEGMAGKLVLTGESSMIIHNYNEWEGRSAIYESKRPFGAALEVLLKWQERILGVLYIDDEVGRFFTSEDASLLGLFADHAAIALVNNEQNDQYEHLVKDSPYGIIASDLNGTVIAYNNMAEKILGYSPEEVLGKPVERLYWDQTMPHQVGQLLREEPAGKVTNVAYYVAAKPKDGEERGEKIPIRLSATWLFDYRGERIGSVGYFEDLRGIQETENQLKRLREGVDEVSKASGLSEGLTSLARKMVEICEATFCHILLFEPDGKSLKVEAAYPITRTNRLGWDPVIDNICQPFRNSEQESLARIVIPLVVHRGVKRYYDELLEHIAEQTNLHEPIQSALIIPLIGEELLLGFCIVAEMRRWERSPFTEKEVELTNSLANQTAAMIVKLRESKRRENQLLILSKISDYIRSAGDLDKKILPVVLTGITAGYGLGFNRAALFLLDQTGKHLQGRMGIGYLLKKEWELVMDEHHQQGMEHFDRYLEKLEQGRVHLTPIGLRVNKLHLPLRGKIKEVFSRLNERKEIINMTQEEISGLPRTFVNALRPGLPMVIVPLMARERVIGLLAADNKFTQREISDETRRQLINFVNSAAIAIENHNLYQEANNARDKIRATFKASNTILSTQPSRQVLVNVGERLAETAEASWASVILADDAGRYQVVNSTGPDQDIKIQEIIRPDGYTVRVLCTGKAAIIPNTHTQRNPRVNQRMYINNVGAAACLPMSLEDKQIGVIWLHYNQPRHFPDYEIDALQLYANHAALAFKNAELFEQVQLTNREIKDVAELMTLGDLEGTLNSVAKAMKDAVRGDAVVLYRYNQGTNRLDHPPTMVGVNEPEKASQFGEVQPESIVYKMLDRKEAIVVTDVKTDPLFKDRRFAREEGICSCIALPLNVSGQKVGIAFVNYRTPHIFSDNDLESINLFGYQAAVTIHNAQLHNETRKHAHTLEGLYHASNALVSSQPSKTVLDEIVNCLQTAANAEWVSVIFFDEARRVIDYNSTKSFWDENIEEIIRPDGYTRRVLSTGIPAIIQDTEKELVLNVNPEFLKKKVKSAACLPMILYGKPIGVVWVHYNQPQYLPEFEIEALQLFANQAAISYDSARKLEALRNARNASQLLAEITLLEDVPKTLDSVSNSIRTALSCDLVTIYTYNEKTKEFGFPGGMKGVIDENTVLELGYVAKGSVPHKLLNQPKNIYVTDDSANDPIIGGGFTNRENIKATVGIILKVKDLKVGIMFVNYRKPHHFSADEITNIELFAGQAAIAIRNAQLHNESRSRTEALRGLYEAGRAITSTLTLNETLKRITEEALRIVGTKCDEEGCFSYVALIEGDKLHFIAASPPDILSILRRNIASLDIKKNPRIGIAGRAAISGISQNIPQVENDPDYLCIKNNIHSHLSVPLQVEERIVGVLSIEHPIEAAFSEEDQQNIELLAAQAAVAIQSASQYEELKRTQGLVGARTALAWMGMASSTWRHAIDKHALTIQEQVQLFRSDLSPTNSEPKMLERLDRIERLAKQILDKPITPPLSTEEGVQSVYVNDLIQARVKQLWEQLAYKRVKLELRLALSNNATSRASPEWLRRALDILLDNAIEVTRNLSKPTILVSTSEADDFVEISITDNGPGIPEEIRDKIFNEPIGKQSGSAGMGTGLLMAQTIIQTYGGNIRFSTNSSGTTMVISLPLES